ncbi:hypothetical protein ZIOFF_049606 [Zingiber officinale]|uniref:Uncharacterized protein n=1 Tax=Zingiber officinale TaxID=94328 RepID=A0A8J5FJW5_ZINOF|nr:hypothetical protein ZIOFF_049606 [Zingiber officinale]
MDKQKKEISEEVYRESTDEESAMVLKSPSDEEEYEFVSLILGTGQIYRKEDKNIENTAGKDKGRRENLEEDLTLRRDCKLYDACSSGLIKQQLIARKEDKKITPCKMVKDLRNNGSEDEALQQPQ